MAVKTGLESLKLDHWSKIVTILAATVFVLSLTVEIKVLPAKEVTLFSLGLLLLGIGEIINHPWQEVIIPPSGMYPGWMKGEGYSRKMSFVGSLFEVLGLIIVGLRSWLLFKQG